MVFTVTVKSLTPAGTVMVPDWVVGHAVAEARRRVVVAAGRGSPPKLNGRSHRSSVLRSGHGVDQRVAFNHAVVADAWRARFNADHARLVVVQDGAGAVTLSTVTLTVSGFSTTLSSMVFTVTVKSLTPAGTVMVPVTGS